MPEIEAYVAKKTAGGTMSYGELIDARTARTAVRAHDIHDLVDILRRLYSGVPLGQAAIVVSDHVTYRMVRMMAALLEGVLSIHPFHSVDDAGKWLGWKR